VAGAASVISPTLHRISGWCRGYQDDRHINNHVRGAYPRDRRRWAAVFCKLLNVSFSLLILGPRMGKNHPLPILAGPDTTATRLSSEESFRREHHGSAVNLRLSFWLNLGRGTRLALARTFFTTWGEVRSSAVFGSPPGHSATVSRMPLRCAAFRRSPATAAPVRQRGVSCTQPPNIVKWPKSVSTGRRPALTDEIRATYLSIAQIWLQAAARLDGGLPIRGGFPVPKRGDGKLTEPEPS
jgi:hypothetical protein